MRVWQWASSQAKLPRLSAAVDLSWGSSSLPSHSVKVWKGGGMQPELRTRTKLNRKCKQLQYPSANLKIVLYLAACPFGASPHLYPFPLPFRKQVPHGPVVRQHQHEYVAGVGAVLGEGGATGPSAHEQGLQGGAKACADQAEYHL